MLKEYEIIQKANEKVLNVSWVYQVLFLIILFLIIIIIILALVLFLRKTFVLDKKQGRTVSKFEQVTGGHVINVLPSSMSYNPVRRITSKLPMLPLQATGEIKNFDNDRDVYVHVSVIKDSKGKIIQKGQQVKFSYKSSHKGCGREATICILV